MVQEGEARGWRQEEGEGETVDEGMRGGEMKGEAAVSVCTSVLGLRHTSVSVE